MTLRDGRPDRSAETVALARASSARRDRSASRNPDHLAVRFLGPVLGTVLRVPPLAALARRSYDRRVPGAARYLNARTHHIDRVVLDAVRDGVDQVVVLGAGYDTRAWRLAEHAAGARFLEVDRPGTQVRKRRIADRRLGGSPRGLRYVAVDFTRDEPLFARLADQGWQTAHPTLFVWEGVSYYLAPAAVDALLADVAAHAAPGSLIVFDYLYASVLTGSSPRYGAERARRYLERRGQPYRSGLPDDGSAAFLAERGFDLVEDLSPEQMGKTYLSTGNEDVLGAYGLATARLREHREHR